MTLIEFLECELRTREMSGLIAGDSYIALAQAALDEARKLKARAEAMAEAVVTLLEYDTTVEGYKAAGAALDAYRNDFPEDGK